MGPVRPNTRPVQDFCQSWLCQIPYMSVRAPYGTLVGHARAPYGAHRIWKTLKIPVQGSYDARTGIAQGTHGVLRISQPNHKYADVSSRTGPVAWCDHRNSTDVKFQRVLHSALRARNRRGDKNRTGPVVGCDWGISQQTVSTAHMFNSQNITQIVSSAKANHCRSFVITLEKINAKSGWVDAIKLLCVQLWVIDASSFGAVWVAQITWWTRSMMPFVPLTYSHVWWIPELHSRSHNDQKKMTYDTKVT